MSKKFAPETNKFNVTKLSLGDGPLRGLQSLLSYISMDLVFGADVEGKFSHADQKIFAELVKKLCPTKVQVSKLLMQDNLQKTPLFKLKKSNGISKPSVFVLLSKREFELLRSIVVDAILGLTERRDYTTMDASERKQHQIWYFASCSVYEQLAKTPNELEFLQALPPCFWSAQSMEHIEQCFSVLREKNDDDTWLANWITTEEFLCSLCDAVSSFPECPSKGADTNSVCPNCFGAVDIKGITKNPAPLVEQTN